MATWYINDDGTIRDDVGNIIDADTITDLSPIGDYVHYYYATLLGSTYKKMLSNLFPRGYAWTRDPDSVMDKLRYGLAEECARIHGRMKSLITERFVTKAAELIPQHEIDYGIPETGLILESTLEDRREVLRSKMLALGKQNRQSFVDLGSYLGFNVYIVDTAISPFYCGWDGCGDAIGPVEVLFYWIAIVSHNNANLEFYDDGYYPQVPRIPKLQDLIVMFNLYKPAQSVILWDYYRPEFDEAFHFGFDARPFQFYYPYPYTIAFSKAFGIHQQVLAFSYFRGAFDMGFGVELGVYYKIDASDYFTGAFYTAFSTAFDLLFVVSPYL